MSAAPTLAQTRLGVPVVQPVLTAADPASDAQLRHEHSTRAWAMVLLGGALAVWFAAARALVEGIAARSIVATLALLAGSMIVALGVVVAIGTYATGRILRRAAQYVMGVL